MYVERIKFERTGGFAGIRLAAEFEMDELPDDQKKQLLELIDEIDLDEILEKLGSKASMPDEFTYNLVITTEHIEHTVMFGDSVMPAEVRPLIEMLESIAKRQMRKKG